MGSPPATRMASPLKTMLLTKVARSIRSRSRAQPPFCLCSGETVGQGVLLLAALHPPPELGVVPEPDLGLDEDGQPVAVGGGDRPERRLDGLVGHQGDVAKALSCTASSTNRSSFESK